MRREMNFKKETTDKKMVFCVSICLICNNLLEINYGFCWQTVKLCLFVLVFAERRRSWRRHLGRGEWRREIERRAIERFCQGLLTRWMKTRGGGGGYSTHHLADWFPLDVCLSPAALWTRRWPPTKGVSWWTFCLHAETRYDLDFWPTFFFFL